MTEFGIHYRAGLISPEMDAKIGQVDAEYRSQALTAAAILRIHKETGQGDPTTTILLVKEQVSNLITLLATFQNTTLHTANLAKATKL